MVRPEFYGSCDQIDLVWKIFSELCENSPILVNIGSYWWIGITCVELFIKTKRSMEGIMSSENSGPFPHYIFILSTNMCP